MDNLKCILGIRMMVRVPNSWIKELYVVTKMVDERIDEGVLWCLAMGKGWRMIGFVRESM